MKKLLWPSLIPVAALALAMALAPAAPVLGADAPCCPGPATAQAAAPAGPAGHEGMTESKPLHVGKSLDYTFSYELMVLPQPTGGDTHHLMVTITAASGKAVSGAKVGFLITRPDKTEQKVMAMAMGAAYGANVNLGTKGKHTIRTKALIEDKTVNESFPYEVK